MSIGHKHDIYFPIINFFAYIMFVSCDNKVEMAYTDKYSKVKYV